MDTSNARQDEGEDSDTETDRNTQYSPRDSLDMNLVDQTIVTPIFETQEPPQSDTGSEQDVEDLPPFTPVPDPDFRWGEVEYGRSFACALNRVYYDEIVQWRRNLFKVPSGKAGKTFVRELSRMFNAYADGSAMKAAMTCLPCSCRNQAPDQRQRNICSTLNTV